MQVAVSGSFHCWVPEENLSCAPSLPYGMHDCQVADFLQPVLLAASITLACMHGCAVGDSPEHVCLAVRSMVHFVSPYGLLSSNFCQAESKV